jgi:serine kinase of HPr protein (carbohydrate metabolism regulator)
MLHRATCVAIGDRALLLEGEPGSGKSSLALSLIDRGAQLIGDDGVALERRGGVLWATAPPNIAGLLEVRNVGLLRFPTTQARVALILRLDRNAPRFVERADSIDLAGVPVPALTFDPTIAGAPIRAELALRQHGA